MYTKNKKYKLDRLKIGDSFVAKGRNYPGGLGDIMRDARKIGITLVSIPKNTDRLVTRTK